MQTTYLLTYLCIGLQEKSSKLEKSLKVKNEEVGL